MKTTNSLLGVLVFFALSSGAVALDPTTTVRTTPLLKTTTSWNGQPLAYPAGPAEITALQVEIAPGGETGWHQHPVPSFGFVLEGTLEVTLKDGQVKRLNPGEALAEVVNTTHNGRNVGAVPVKIMVFYAGTPGQPLTIKEPLP
ncbi:MAG: cupin domain-containing protein [Candidatus Contendobacter sp.]|nr:cupin domain-containing protein [Candidatus Contendobacter sp.]MDG4556681.1 cupin domain-containing protein [Candidatus Contendobacter sp.]